MARYAMDDGTFVETDKAVLSFDEDTQWNGNNHISCATGSQWDHETLYQSRKGRWYIVHTSQWQGSLPRAYWVSAQEAARWMLANDHVDEMPDDLQQFVEELTE